MALPGAGAEIIGRTFWQVYPCRQMRPRIAADDQVTAHHPHCSLTVIGVLNMFSQNATAAATAALKPAGALATLESNVMLMIMQAPTAQ